MSFLDYTVIRIETFGEYNRVVLLGERRNAFSRQLIERLSGVDCDKDLVITNEGPVFSAGLDLAVFLQSKDAVLGVPIQRAQAREEVYQLWGPRRGSRVGGRVWIRRGVSVLRRLRRGAEGKHKILIAGGQLRGVSAVYYRHWETSLQPRDI